MLSNNSNVNFIDTELNKMDILFCYSANLPYPLKITNYKITTHISYCQLKIGNK